MVSTVSADVMDMRGDVVNWPIRVGGIINVRGYGESRVVAVDSVHFDRVVILICPTEIEDWMSWPRESSLQVVVRRSDMYLSGLWAWRYPWIK